MGYSSYSSDSLSWVYDYSSPYCVISPISDKYMDFIDEIRDNVGFAAIIEKRVEAGLPFDSLMDTIRRLLIILSKNKNINKIILFGDSSRNEELDKIYKLIKEIKKLTDDDWERIYLRGRMKNYRILKTEIKETISRIESIEEFDLEKNLKICNCSKDKRGKIETKEIAGSKYS